MTEEIKIVEKKQERSERKEVFVDFDGTAGLPSTKVTIPEDSYAGTVEGADLIETPVYNHPDQVQKKVVLRVKLSVDNDEEVVLSMYANPVIKKSSGTKGFSNSKLFDLLVSAGELETAKEQHDALETFEGLVGFLDARLKGRGCKALVGTVNKGSESAYSVVKNILRFDQQEAKE